MRSIAALFDDLPEEADWWFLYKKRAGHCVRPLVLSPSAVVSPRTLPRGTRGSGGIVSSLFKGRSGGFVDMDALCAYRPARKGPDIASGPWFYLLRRSLVLELGRKELAVQTGDMRDGNLLGALGLAGSRVGAVAEAQLVHFGDHRLGAAGALHAALGQLGQ